MRNTKAMPCQWKDKVFSITEKKFEELALELFRFQYANNGVYQQYVNALQVQVNDVHSLPQIPFLPICFFKTRPVQTTSFDPAIIFESSGTTGIVNSRHFIKDTELYKESVTKGFELFYGPEKNWCIIGLLPSYLEKQNSSLVYMVNELIKQSGNNNSGFYLNEYEQLFSLLTELENKKQKTLLIGVTFGLLDFAEAYSSHFYKGLFKHTVVIETGGMKGRRREMIRQEVHDILKATFDVPVIHSEYGMTELLSQAYSDGNGIFKCPPWMKVSVRDEDDPLRMPYFNGMTLAKDNPKSMAYVAFAGAINIIDLANVYSCSFIATDDAGKIFPDGSFEVLGRMDNCDLRGCSLMAV
ncbi:MAG: LuxE/PaaK family acyltransferase [Chitinophagaceae bacterium]